MPAQPLAYEVRTVECQNCGAPVTAPLAGGSLQCEYCEAALIIQGRPQEIRRETQISEEERIQGLKFQRLPESIQLVRPPEGMEEFFSHLEKLQDYISTPALEAFRQEWEATRAKANATQAADTSLELRLFRLAVILAEHRYHDDPTRARAILETALDYLSDGEQRDIIRCRIVRVEAQAGELSAAKAWLGDVNPRPIKLESEIELRIAQAIIQLAEKDYTGVVEGLSREKSINGYAPELPLPIVLRVHAFAGLGEEKKAASLMPQIKYDNNLYYVRTLFDRYPGPADALVRRFIIHSGGPLDLLKRGGWVVLAILGVLGFGFSKACGCW